MRRRERRCRRGSPRPIPAPPTAEFLFAQTRAGTAEETLVDVLFLMLLGASAESSGGAKGSINSLAKHMAVAEEKSSTSRSNASSAHDSSSADTASTTARVDVSSSSKEFVLAVERLRASVEFSEERCVEALKGLVRLLEPSQHECKLILSPAVADPILHLLGVLSDGFPPEKLLATCTSPPLREQLWSLLMLLARASIPDEEEAMSDNASLASTATTLMQTNHEIHMVATLLRAQIKFFFEPETLEFWAGFLYCRICIQQGNLFVSSADPRSPRDDVSHAQLVQRHHCADSGERCA